MAADEKHQSVLAIIVAYNDLASVEKCLAALTRQSHALDGIVLIDNSTSRSVQASIEALTKGDTTFYTYWKSDQNLGSAGGFAKGMELAHQQGATWVWLHDQDDYPEETCLEKLLSRGKGRLRTPVIRDPSSKHILAYFKRLHGRLGYFYPAPPNASVVDVAGTAGLLIHRDVIDNIGVYDPSFFVGFEDYEYCLRAQKAGFEIHVQKDAAVYHPDHQSEALSKRRYLEHILRFSPAFLGVVRKGSVRDEYAIRNLIVISKRYQSVIILALQIGASIAALPFMKLFRPRVQVKKTLTLYMQGLCAE